MVIVWNVGTGESIMFLELPDTPLCASWNYDGSKFVVSCKDRKVKIVNPRTGEIIKVRIEADF